MQDSSRSAGLKGGVPYGCLFALLLGLGMTVAIMMGTLLGDCLSGYDCPDKGSAIVQGIALAMPIVVGSAILIGLVAALLRSLLLAHMRPLALRVLLVGFTFATLWLGFRPAFDLYFWLGTRL